jgi:ubiquitin C-terminal hydrolase
MLDGEAFEELRKSSRREPWSKDSLTRMPGFGNMGNTCFANSVL